MSDEAEEAAWAEWSRLKDEHAELEQRVTAAWDRAQSIGKGKPVDFAPAKPTAVLRPGIGGAMLPLAAMGKR